MKPKYWDKVREILMPHHDGLTTAQIAEAIGKDAHAVYRALHRMPDVYLDRWVGVSHGQYAAVWCRVHIPESCPHPVRGKTLGIETNWR